MAIPGRREVHLPPLGMPVQEPLLWLGAAALTAVVHLVGGRRVELTPASAALGIGAVWSGAAEVPGGPWVLAGIALATFLATLRGRLRGLGRVDLVVGIAVYGVAAWVLLDSAAGPWLAARLGPDAAAAGLRAGLLALAGVVALEAWHRPGPVGLRIHHHREVPVTRGRHRGAAGETPAHGADRPAGSGAVPASEAR